MRAEATVPKAQAREMVEEAVVSADATAGGRRTQLAAALEHLGAAAGAELLFDRRKYVRELAKCARVCMAALEAELELRPELFQ